MNTTRNCGCKGYRSCYICEKEFNLPTGQLKEELVNSYGDKAYTFCVQCKQIVLSNTWDVSKFSTCDKSGNHANSIVKPFPGVQIIQEFITEAEEVNLVKDLDLIGWDTSQSGRRKQNFGPRANFKKRKAKVGEHFRGFPQCTKFIQDRFQKVLSLEGYQTIEQCSIEYRPETGASIEPHIDDCWIWGERIVQLNMLSDSTLTCLPFKNNKEKYNLADVKTYPRVLNTAGKVLFNPFKDTGLNLKDAPNYSFIEGNMNDLVRIPLPRRSLLVFYGEPRYEWEHCILREDIADRRVIIAYREFTPTYLPGGREHLIGEKIIEKAKCFWT